MGEVAPRTDQAKMLVCKEVRRGHGMRWEDAGQALPPLCSTVSKRWPKGTAPLSPPCRRRKLLAFANARD